MHLRFEEILVLLTVVTGVVVLLNYFYRKALNISKPAKQNWAIETCRSFFPVFLLVLVLRSFLFEPFRIPTGSMRPTLIEGDFILVNKFVYGLRLPVFGTTIIPISKPKAGDILIFRHDKGEQGMDMIKRVIGAPGDHIRYSTYNKELYINGNLVETFDSTPTTDHGRYAVKSIEKLSDRLHYIYTYHNAPHIFYYTDVIVPPNSYFVMGDNRDNSADSRVWGFVEDRDILGKALVTWMSWDNDNKTVRWSRIGKSVYQNPEQTDK